MIFATIRSATENAAMKMEMEDVTKMPTWAPFSIGTVIWLEAKVAVRLRYKKVSLTTARELGSEPVGMWL